MKEMEMNHPKRSETGVLIAGAGPVGLTLACELRRRGVACRVIDKLEAPLTTSRALGIQSRVLELFDNMGIVERVLEKGRRVFDTNIYEGEKLLFCYHFKVLSASEVPYPFIIELPQDMTERFLYEKLLELGGTVERMKELTDFRREPDAVIATVHDTSTGTEVAEEIRARWLVGCDGAHSLVRKRLGFTFEGNLFPEQFVLADVDMDWKWKPNKQYYWLHRDTLFMAQPLPYSGQWRIMADIDPADGGAAPEPSVELFQRLLAERTGDKRTVISNPTWLSTFRIHWRTTDNYRSGRVFLAGDAAHICSPFGAQGMNCGIQDAFNLGWKLALVVNGKAPVALLDSYTAERLPAARDISELTQSITNLLILKNPEEQDERDHVLVPLLNQRRYQYMLVRRIADLTVHYRTSPLSRTYRARLEEEILPSMIAGRHTLYAGDRAPDGHCQHSETGEKTRLHREFRGPHFNILLFAGDSSAPHINKLVRIGRRLHALVGDEVKTHIVVNDRCTRHDLDWNGSLLCDPGNKLAEKYGAPADSLYLIRPDGHIAFISHPVEWVKLLTYLDSIFRITE
jgi:2-polyprenyl-6-methoxyphenol hydroxylase-like FAD-dependent oxidoreductase